jgi:hypothetical protein
MAIRRQPHHLAGVNRHRQLRMPDRPNLADTFEHHEFAGGGIEDRGSTTDCR